jgi:hypothetical protein
MCEGALAASLRGEDVIQSSAAKTVPYTHPRPPQIFRAKFFGLSTPTRLAPRNRDNAPGISTVSEGCKNYQAPCSFGTGPVRRLWRERHGYRIEDTGDVLRRLAVIRTADNKLMRDGFKTRQDATRYISSELVPQRLASWMPKPCSDKASETIAGSILYDVRLDALWHHQSVKAALPREYRVALINEASRYVVGDEAWMAFD